MRRPERACFTALVELRGDTECWPWQGAVDECGYGLFHALVNGVRKTVRAHRYAFQQEHGEIPPGMIIMHRCDNPPCCNPRHLAVGTHADNAADRGSKGRSATGMRCGVHTHPECRAFGLRNGIHTHPDRLPYRAKGSASVHAKLTEDEVIEILRLLAAGSTQTSLAARYGVSHACVWRIASRKNWRHIQPEPLA